MASWQATLWLVPAGVDVADPESAWIDVPVGYDVVRVLAYVLPQSEAKAGETAHFGDYERHDIQLAASATTLEYIRLRADLRAPDVMQLLTDLWSATQIMGADCMTPEGKRLEPEPRTWADYLATTLAARFVSDPTGYLATIRDEAV